MDTTRISQNRSSPATLIAAAFIVLALAATGAWHYRPAAAESMSPVTVESGQLLDTVPVNAILAPSRTGAVATVSGGTVTERVAYAGQAVKAGDVLLRLGNADLERQLAEALSERAGARAELVSQQADSQDQANSLQMDKINAESAVRIATMQFDAESKLQQQGVISMLALNRTGAEREAKLAQRDYAAAHITQAHAASRAKISAASERAALHQARADSLQAAVDQLTLRAPFDGVVSKIEGNSGATIAAGATLAEVISPDLQINLEVAEQYADAVKTGQPLRLQGGLTGKVLSISPSAEGGVVKGRASIDGDTSRLRSNTSLPGEAVLADHGTGLYIQLEGTLVENRTVEGAVLDGAGQSNSRQLRFGPRYRQRVAVLAGAKAGEQITALDLDAK